MTVPFVFVASFIDKSSLHVGELSVLGLFFWFYAGIAIFVRVFFRRLPDRVGPFRVLVTGGIVMSVGMLSYSVVDAQYPLTILIPALLCGTGHALMFHTMMSLTIQSFPSEVRGAGSALGLMMLDIGTVGGAPILGEIGDRYGFSWLFATVGLTCMLTTLLYAASHLYQHRERSSS